MKTNFMSLFFFCIILGTFSQASPVEQEVKNCKDVGQYIHVDISCKTSTGIVWTRVPLGWKDTVTGYTWKNDQVIGLLEDVLFIFGNDNCRLPTGWSESQNGKNGFPDHDSDWVTAEKHGIREVLKNMNNKWFWSRSFLKENGSLYRTYYFINSPSKDINYLLIDGANNVSGFSHLVCHR
jgi:hypothetical protein